MFTELALVMAVALLAKTLSTLLVWPAALLPTGHPLQTTIATTLLLSAFSTAAHNGYCRSLECLQCFVNSVIVMQRNRTVKAAVDVMVSLQTKKLSSLFLEREHAQKFNCQLSIQNFLHSAAL